MSIRPFDLNEEQVYMVKFILFLTYRGIYKTHIRVIEIIVNIANDPKNPRNNTSPGVASQV